MANIFTLENIDNFSEKISIDELYDKKQQSDLSKLELFNKILNRIHVRIKTTSRQKMDEQFCWFVVPELIIGVPRYDQGACIAYLMDKLTTNGFHVKYIHPNTLLIVWSHWVPSYVRSEFKKKTGIEVDEYGKKIDENLIMNSPSQDKNPNQFMNIKEIDNQAKKYTPIKSYKPSGQLLYNEELFTKIETKL